MSNMRQGETVEGKSTHLGVLKLGRNLDPVRFSSSDGIPVETETEAESISSTSLHLLGQEGASRANLLHRLKPEWRNRSHQIPEAAGDPSTRTGAPPMYLLILRCLSGIDRRVSYL
jgi:hypothetical protein